MTDPAPALPQPTDEDRRQHLGFIQAVITRMSAASSTAKGWLLPVVTVTYGYALTQNDGSIALLGIAAVGLFAMLDANYLRQEQAYRRLYATVARKRRPVPSFTLDPSEADDPPQADAPPGKKVRVWVGRWRDAHVVAFFPLEPATLGHTLVVPRRHIPDIWSLNEHTATQLARVTVRLSNVMRRALQMEGLNVIQSNGEVATQTVFHLHVHLVPRWKGDAIGRIWPPEMGYSESEKDAAWENLRAACREEMGRE